MDNSISLLLHCRRRRHCCHDDECHQLLKQSEQQSADILDMSQPITTQRWHVHDWSVGSLVFYGHLQHKQAILCHRSMKYIVHGRGQDKNTIKQWNNTLNWKSHKRSLAWALWRWPPYHKRHLQRSLLCQSLGKYWQLNQETWLTSAWTCKH